MKALIFNKTLQFVTNYEKPIPQKSEALIRVSLAGICNTDREITQGYLGFTGVLGHEFVGVVEEINDSDQRLLGQRVVAEINTACEQCSLCQSGLQRHCLERKSLGIWQKDGCFAEYLTWPIKDLLVVPDSIPDEQAVFVEPLAAGLEILEQLHIDPMAKVIILGDGKLGLITALALNASNIDVLLVGKHQNKLNIARAKGLKTSLLSELVILKEWDFVIEATGSITGFDTALSLVKPRGTLVLKSTIAATKEFNLAPIVIDEIKVQGSRCGRFAPALRLLATKKIDCSSLISEVFSINDGLKAIEKNNEKGVLKVLIKF